VRRPHVIPVDAAAREHRDARLARSGWIAGAAVLLLLVCVQPLRDTDVWWHLALGRYITVHGIPAHEPFSFLPAAYPWVGQQWLYEVVLAGLIGAGGPALASVVMGTAAVLAIVIAAFALPRDARVPGAWMAVAMVLSGLVMAQVLGVRGQVLSVLGLALVLLVVRRWRDGRNGFLWLLPPLFLVWANVHAGFIAGLMLLAATLLIVGRGASGAAPSRRHLGLALLASVAATLVNPAGPGIYPYILETFTNPTLTQTIVEWASPDFHNVWLRLFEGEVILLVVLWVASGGPDAVDAAFAGGTLVATLFAQRNVSLFAVVAIPQVALYGARAWRMHVAPRMSGRWRFAPRRAAVLTLTAAGAVALAVAVTLGPELTPTAEADSVASRYPVAPASYVAAHYAGQRLYSIDTWGGYLVYRFPDQRVVFLYDETAVFGNAALQRYLDIHLLRKGWPQVLKSEQIEHAIVPLQSQETSALHELGWTIDCYDAASGSVVMSAAPASAGIAQTALEIPLADPTPC